MKGKYAVIEFVEELSVEIILSTWIIGEDQVCIHIYYNEGDLNIITVDHKI